MDLIIGLLQPPKGEVLIDDVSLNDIDLKKWRRKIGYIPQETLLLHDSIFNNVGLGDPTDLGGRSRPGPQGGRCLEFRPPDARGNSQRGG